MNAHKNVRLMPHSRAVLVRYVAEDGQMPKAAAVAFGICPKTAAKWVVRFRTEDIADLRDRSFRPHKVRQPAPEYVICWIETLAAPAMDRPADRHRTWHLSATSGRAGSRISTPSHRRVATSTADPAR